MSSPCLSPKLQERRDKRESRSRPWRSNSKPVILHKVPHFTEYYPLLNGLSRTVSPIPAFHLKHLRNLGQLRSEKPKAFKFRQLENFPFMRLPFDIQVLIGEYVVSSKCRFKAEGKLSANTLAIGTRRTDGIQTSSRSKMVSSTSQSRLRL